MNPKKNLRCNIEKKIPQTTLSLSPKFAVEKLKIIATTGLHNTAEWFCFCFAVGREKMRNATQRMDEDLPRRMEHRSR